MLSTKGRYGLRAMIELAIRNGDGPVLSHVISERQAIPQKYLEAIMLDLKKAGLVRSIRGPKGGYILAKNPDSITMEDIITSLEGPIHLTDCSTAPEICERCHICPSHDVWVEMTEMLRSHLKAKNLHELANSAIEKMKGEGI